MMSVEYKMVIMNNFNRQDKFEKQVGELLSDGWELHGSPVISMAGVVQAMTKHKKTTARGKAR